MAALKTLNNDTRGERHAAEHDAEVLFNNGMGIVSQVLYMMALTMKVTGD